MALTTTQKDLLNKFSDTQIALRDKDKKYPESSMPLGDLMESALAGPKLLSFTYDFAKAGGTVGTKVLGSIPAGYKLTGRLWTDVTTALAGAGSSVAIEAGATVLVAATAFDDAALVGFDAQAAFTPLKLAAATNLEWVISGAVLTAGKATVYVEVFE
jgi:hypothetical protein